MRHDSLYLTDIVEAADHIADFIAGKGFDNFQQSELLRSGVLQKLTIIGEAAARVSEPLTSRNPDIPWPQIVAFRNILVHAYFGIDWDLVWRAAKNRCPELRNQVAAILAVEASAAKPVRAFERYIGIDYSGAQTPLSSLSGLRVYLSDASGPPIEVPPPPSPRKYWTRRGVAEWLLTELQDGPPTLVGIDHAFSFPTQYFEYHGLPLNWQKFLVDFQRHWPTDRDHLYVDFVRDGLHGDAAARSGNSRWRRATEVLTRAKSVFHFDVQGSVAKSTHSGIPWLLYLQRNLGVRVHFWPFDGWQIPAGRSAIAEVYPALWSNAYAREDRIPDQHDAYSVAAWMRSADVRGSLRHYLNPPLNEEQRQLARYEGWILGVQGK
ncbi:MAG: HepT-like ribonuclease domain-containing protein [Acidobacteriota bacterium]